MITRQTLTAHPANLSTRHTPAALQTALFQRHTQHAKASMSAQSKQQPSKPATRFGRIPLKLNGLDKAFKWLDFHNLTEGTANQVTITFFSCGVARVIAAWDRKRESGSNSNNEIWETLFRDPGGYFLWVGTTPVLQRATLWFTEAKYPEYKGTLLKEAPKPTGPAGISTFLKTVNWTVNPLSRWSIPTSQQVNDWKEQALLKLNKTGHNQKTEVYQTLKKNLVAHYDGLIKARNAATGIGWVSTILLLGIVIPLVNIVMTKGDVKKRKQQALLKQAPTSPPKTNALPPTAYVKPPEANPWASSSPSSIKTPFVNSWLPAPNNAFIPSTTPSIIPPSA